MNIKSGLQLPYTSQILSEITKKDINNLDMTRVTANIVRRLQLKHKTDKKLKIILDKWKKSGHSAESSDALINCIRGR